MIHYTERRLSFVLLTAILACVVQFPFLAVLSPCRNVYTGITPLRQANTTHVNRTQCSVNIIHVDG